jgi:hypothetical protein
MNVVLEHTVTWTLHVQIHWEISTVRAMMVFLEMARIAKVNGFLCLFMHWTQPLKHFELIEHNDHKDLSRKS